MTPGVAFGAGGPTAWSTQVRDTEKDMVSRGLGTVQRPLTCVPRVQGSPYTHTSTLYIFGAERSLRTELCALKFSLGALVGHPGPPNVAVFGDL